jgi:VCBS repeat-containing protein
MDATDVDGLTDTTYFTVTTPATNGTAAIDAETGVWTFTPTDANWFGSDTFTVTITDNLGGTTTQVVSITLSNVNDVPAGLPLITGTVTEGQLLTADTSGISDADGLGPYSYQWLRDGVAIAGATASTYTLGDADVGTQISVEVSYTDGHGTAETVTSVQTAAVANINDAPVGVPTISGTVTEDQILTANIVGISDADGLGAFSYQWLRNGVAIAGATASTYTLGDADVGTQISVEVSYTDSHGTAETVTSAQTAAVANINDAPSATNLNAGEPYNEETVLDLIDIVVSDVDSTNVTITLILSDPAAGTLSTGTSGAVTSTFVGGVWTASGAIADVNTLLTNVTFTPALNYNSNFTIAAGVDDGVAAPVTGMKMMNFVAVNDAPTEPIPGPADDGNIPPDDFTDDPDSDDDIVEDPVNEPVEDLTEEGLQEEETVSLGKSVHSFKKNKLTVSDNSALKYESLEIKFDSADLTGNGTEDRNTETMTLSLSGLLNKVVNKISDIAYNINTSIEALGNSVESIERHDNNVTKTVLGGTLTLSTGLAIWILRGGSLVASALTTMPIWKGFDPLHVLPLTGKERRKKIRVNRKIEKEESSENKEIAELFDSGNKQHVTDDKEANKS